MLVLNESLHFDAGSALYALSCKQIGPQIHRHYCWSNRAIALSYHNPIPLADEHKNKSSKHMDIKDTVMEKAER